MPRMLPIRRRTAMAPWREFDRLEDRLSQLSKELFGNGEVEEFGWRPVVDVVETDDELRLTAELAGVKPEDLEIEVEGDTLRIHGEKKEERKEEKEKGESRYRVWERSYGEFSRAFTLPSSVSADEVQADFKNAVLTVHIPKKETAKGRKVKIETG